MPDFDEWDLRATILEVASEYTRHRPSAAAPVDGFAGGPTFADATILMHVEPASGNQLQRLPEGKRSVATLRGMAPENDNESDPVLRAASVAGGYGPDEVTIRGERWQVADLKHHTPTGRYYDALLQRVGRG